MGVECASCQGTGFRLTEGAGGVVSSIPCPCESEGRGERLLVQARIPPRYEHCTLDSFEIHDPSHEMALRVAREWCGHWPAVQQGLLLLGGPGTGKTHLAVAMARELARAGARVLFHEQRALLKALQRTFETGSAQQESEILGPVLEAEVLLLDDLGAGRTTPWARDVMHDVIAHRYNQERPLIMTSNHATGDEVEPGSKAGPAARDAPLTLRDRLGDALMSRLHEMCRIVRIQGKDYRTWILPHKHHG